FNLGFDSLNLSISVLEVLEGLGNVPEKKSIVLLTTGLDTSPSNDSAEAVQRLRTGDVRLLAISLTGGLRNPPPAGKKKPPVPSPTQPEQQFEQADQLLKRMAEAQAGRAYFTAHAQQFNG